MAKNILLTGGNGFVGRALVHKLSEGYAFYYTYKTGPVRGFESKGLKVDLLDESTFIYNKDVLCEITDLIHTAAFVPSKNNNLSLQQEFDEAILNSLLMLKNLIINLPKLKRAVFISSCYAGLRDPAIGFYGTGKSLTEGALHQFARIRNFHSIALRFPQLYGPREPHGVYINRFAELNVDGKPIVIDDKSSLRRDALFIEDAVGGVLHALDLEGHETITISSDVSTSPLEVARLIKSRWGGEIIEPVEFEDGPDTYHFKSTYNKLDFQIEYSLEEGISRTVDYYRKLEK